MTIRENLKMAMGFQGQVAFHMLQWLRLHTPSAGALDLIPAQGTRSHMLALKIQMLHAAN